MDSVKSEKNLQTLLDLSETYISMEDYEAARESLNEVLEQGSDKQKQKAQQLLDKLGDK
jgi:pilus assembly protein FimV